jgi:1,2-dihydroxy-3-keto-5-methylthiopentene dioxygenase
MRAYFLDNPEQVIGTAKLADEGIFYRLLPTSEEEYAEPLAALCAERGYVAQDVVHLGTATPNLDLLLEKFYNEHLHTDEEIRFVVAGEGIFDLRDVDDRWMRVHVVPGDLIIVPANKYHRFALDHAMTITCKRLFQNQDGWAAINR